MTWFGGWEEKQKERESERVRGREREKHFGLSTTWTELLRTPNSTRLEFEVMTSRS